MNIIHKLTASHRAHQFCNIVHSKDVKKCADYIEKYNDFYNSQTSFAVWKQITPLIYTCYKGLETVAMLLLDRGCDVNAVTEDNESSLIYACLFGRTNLALKLIERGADVDIITTYSGTSVLSHCITDQVIEAIINKSSNVHIILEHQLAAMIPRKQSIASKYIKLRYRHDIIHIMNDKADDNLFGTAFETTYVPQIAGIICNFIL
ncbi:MAG: hypothetical protein Faunusvirus11_17 [Faunusvirus sp.]|jgi:ankyrin repeat protein|uniref:Uncharacterized protein n=1 Tax=Faunusvirus sp. TaxID=2487766 RepID=A0A3G4ZWU1_9VIRU|nr:MAG: hypothetical protein Faunusvirus11_17 [Faunusvirus sp.]